MVKIKNINLPLRFLGWLFFFYILLIAISLYGVYFQTGFFLLWFWLLHPFIWILIYIPISFKYDLFKRAFPIVGLPSCILIFLFDTFLFWLKIYNPNTAFEPYVIISAMFFFVSFTSSGIFAFIISIIITKIKKINDKDIPVNSVSFQLIGNDEQKKAKRFVFLKFVEKVLGYDLYVTGSKDYIVFKESFSFPFSVKHLLITHDSNNLSIFPYIKDGAFYEPNLKLVPSVAVIGMDILNLDISSTHASNLIENFRKATKMNKAVEVIKNIHHRDLGIALFIILGAIVTLIVLSNPQIFVDNRNTIIITVSSWIIPSIISAILARWLDKRNDESKK